jgi:hypothetical protein
MLQKVSHSDRTQRSSPANLLPPEFDILATEGMEGLAQAQSEFLEKIQKINKDWLHRLQLEAIVASEFATKLITARSISETATVCRGWATRRVVMAAEDGKRLLENSQQFLEMGRRFYRTSRYSRVAGAVGDAFQATATRIAEQPSVALSAAATSPEMSNVVRPFNSRSPAKTMPLRRKNPRNLTKKAKMQRNARRKKR